MKKLFSLAVVSAVIFAVYRSIIGQQHEEELWREATTDLDQGA